MQPVHGPHGLFLCISCKPPLFMEIKMMLRLIGGKEPTNPKSDWTTRKKKTLPSTRSFLLSLYYFVNCSFLSVIIICPLSLLGLPATSITGAVVDTGVGELPLELLLLTLSLGLDIGLGLADNGD